MEFCRTNPPARLLRHSPANVKTVGGVKFVAQDGSWLMPRGLATEPILGVYAEARCDVDARKLLALGERMTRAV